MFIRQHAYQVILQVSFGRFDGTYQDDRMANPGTRLYTFAPQSSCFRAFPW
jgi:hypothetical protein